MEAQSAHIAHTEGVFILLEFDGVSCFNGIPTRVPTLERTLVTCQW